MVAPDATINLVAQAQTNCARLHLYGTPDAALPLLSAAAPMKTGGRSGPGNFIDIPAGPLTLRNVMDLYPYPNIVSIIRVAGAEVAEWLEFSAGMFNHILPGQRDMPLLNPDFPSYNFDVITGLEYEIDLSQPARYNPDGSAADMTSHRIRGLRYAGQPVMPDQIFMLATNNFRSAGAGGFPKIKARPELLADTELSMVLCRQAETTHSLPTDVKRVWRFTQVHGATAWFDTSPAAHNRLNEAKGADLEEIGFSAQGFLRLRLKL